MMSGKLPVERTIADAYRFAFLRFLSVLGTIWLPYLILIVIVLGLIRLIAPDVPKMLATGELDVAAGMELLRLAALVSIFAFLAAAMVTVDLQRKAMGTQMDLPYVFFSLRAPVWRMAGASFLGMVVIGIVALVAGGICFAIWWVAGSLGPVGALIRLISVLATIAVIFYIALRLMFFLPAVVVAEDSIGLERAWNLGRRNFWRILIVTIAVAVPIVFVGHLLLWAFFGASAALHELAGQGGLRALLRSGAMESGLKGYLILLLALIERILLLGLLNGAVASGYSAVNRDGEASAAAAHPE
jgi:hypothetical protein